MQVGVTGITSGMMAMLITDQPQDIRPLSKAPASAISTLVSIWSLKVSHMG